MKHFIKDQNGNLVYFRDIKTQKTNSNKQSTKNENPLFLVLGLLFFFTITFIFSYALLTQNFFASFVLSVLISLMSLPILTIKK